MAPQVVSYQISSLCVKPLWRSYGNPPENLTPRLPPFRSLNVIGIDTDRSAACDFLLAFHSNRGPLSHRFWDKRRFLSKISNFFHPRVLKAPSKGVSFRILWRRQRWKKLGSCPSQKVERFWRSFWHNNRPRRIPWWRCRELQLLEWPVYSNWPRNWNNISLMISATTERQTASDWFYAFLHANRTRLVTANRSRISIRVGQTVWYVVESQTLRLQCPSPMVRACWPLW